MEDLIRIGKVGYEPIVYEDFLPASAAGIFQSNLVESASNSVILGQAGDRSLNFEEETGVEDGDMMGSVEFLSSREVFERALGGKVFDYWEMYETMEKDSIDEVGKALKISL